MEGWLEVLGRPDRRKESWECDAILFQLIVYFLKKYFFLRYTEAAQWTFLFPLRRNTAFSLLNVGVQINKELNKRLPYFLKAKAFIKNLELRFQC